MEVYKFGGASLANLKNIKRVVSIIKNSEQKDLVIVVSAMGKTTDYLENVWQTHLKDGSWLEQLLVLQKKKFDLIDKLFYANAYDVKDGVRKLFDGLIQFLNNNSVDNEDYIYDQVVVLGELCSSYILSRKLTEEEVDNHFHYAKQLIRTDETYRAGKVDWEQTNDMVNATFQSGIYVTQGFVGGTQSNQNTTLGRESADYSAGIFASCLKAKKLTIWKDVEGVYNADPKLVKTASKIDKLSYEQAALLTHYGAKVIHPKTIVPLQAAKVALCVRSYENLEATGTNITEEKGDLSAIFIQKKNQLLFTIKAKDRYLNPRDMSDILYLCKEIDLPIYFTQFSPITLKVSTNNESDKLDVLENNLPESLKIDSKILRDMGVYHKKLENLPPLKNISHLQDDGVYRIMLGKF